MGGQAWDCNEALFNQSLKNIKSLISIEITGTLVKTIYNSFNFSPPSLCADLAEEKGLNRSNRIQQLWTEVKRADCLGLKIKLGASYFQPELNVAFRIWSNRNTEFTQWWCLSQHTGHLKKYDVVVQDPWCGQYLLIKMDHLACSLWWLEEIVFLIQSWYAQLDHRL